MSLFESLENYRIKVRYMSNETLELCLMYELTNYMIIIGIGLLTLLVHIKFCLRYIKRKEKMKKHIL